MLGKLWGISKDGTIEYRSLVPNQLQDAMNVMRRSFFVDEKVCIAVELSKYPEAATEFEEICINAAKDGVSLVAIEKNTGAVVGAAINKLQQKSDEQEAYFQRFIENSKYESSRVLVQFMNDIDATVDLFEVTKAKCLLEIMFAAILPEYRGKGICKDLFKVCFSLTKDLMTGNNIKVSFGDKSSALEPVPTVVTAILTSVITQRITEQLGFIKTAEVSYEKFMYRGNSFASLIGPDTPTVTIAYKIVE